MCIRDRSYTIRVEFYRFDIFRLGAKRAWNLTLNYPFGIILEKMSACAKPFWKLLKIYRFYLDPHFSAWGQKGLEPDP